MNLNTIEGINACILHIVELSKKLEHYQRTEIRAANKKHSISLKILEQEHKLEVNKVNSTLDKYRIYLIHFNESNPNPNNRSLIGPELPILSELEYIDSENTQNDIGKDTNPQNTNNDTLYSHQSNFNIKKSKKSLFKRLFCGKNV